MLLEIVLVLIGSSVAIAVVLVIALWLRPPAWRDFPDMACKGDASEQPMQEAARKKLKRKKLKHKKPMPACPAKPYGIILWNPADRMKVGRRETVEVRLGDTTVTETMLRERLRGRGTPNVDRLEIAPLMRVSLDGDTGDFSIQSINSRDQYVRPGKIARWDFSVIPLRSGIRRLRLLASMRVRVEGTDEVVDLPTYEREVRVAVAPVRAVGRFVGKNWQWAAGTVAIPLIVWTTKDTDAGKAALKHLRNWLGMG